MRKRIGTGSPNTVHKHLTAWRAARPQATVAAPELPARARAEVETKLVQSQQEAAELADAGESLETERDELLEQVAELTTERDTLAGKADQQAADIKAQVERIEREQQAAEAARVDLGSVDVSSQP